MDFISDRRRRLNLPETTAAINKVLDVITNTWDKRPNTKC